MLGFCESLGPVGLHQILAGYEDKSATATCHYALMEDEKTIRFFIGSLTGKIVAPRGDKGWPGSWDPVFEEETTRKTFGELEPALKEKISHRSKAVAALREYLLVS